MANVWLELCRNDFKRLGYYDRSRGELGYFLRLQAGQIAWNLVMRQLARSEHLPEAAGEEPLNKRLEDQVVSRDLLERLAQRARARLGESDWALFNATFVEGLTSEEMATRSGTLLKTVYQQKYRLRAKLEALVQELLDETSPTRGRERWAQAARGPGPRHRAIAARAQHGGPRAQPATVDIRRPTLLDVEMMTHDAPIPELLAAHLAATTTPQVWLDVAHGSVTPEQAAEEVAGRESPALIQRSKRLFAPPSAKQERAIRRRVLEHAPREPRRSSGWIGEELALAAVLALVMLLLPPEREEPAAPSVGSYTKLELSSSSKSVRGGPDRSSQVYRVEQIVTFTLRPETGTSETERDVLVLTYDEQGHPVQLGPQRRLHTKNGTLRFSARLDELGLTAGTWPLVLVISLPGQLPDELDQVDDDIPYRIIHGSITVEE